MAIEIKVNLSGDEQIDNLAKSVGKTSDSVKSLKQQFIDARKELMSMDETDPGFIQKAAEAGKLKDQIADMNAVIKATAGSTTENLGNAFGGVASIGIGAFQGIASAQALFGAESEDLQKVLVKLQAAAGMADAIRSFGQFGDTMTQVKAALGSVTAAMFTTATATQAEAAATGEATVAQIGLNTAMLANPIFLVIAALGALTAAYFYFSSQSESAAEAEKKRQKAIDDRRKAQEKAAKEESKELASMQSAYALQIGMLSKTNAGSKERLTLINSINKEYGTSLKNIKDEAKFQDQLSDSLEKYLLLKRVEYQVRKNEAYFESLMAKESDARKAIAKEKIKISEEDIKSILKVQDTKERAYKMEQILLAKNPNRNLSQMAPEVKALIDLRDEQERVAEATFKLQNVKGSLIATTTTGNDKTKEEIQLNHELKQTLDELLRKNEEYGKTELELADLQKIRRDAEIEAQYKISTDKDKDAQRTKALAESKISYDNQVTDITNKNTETRKQKEQQLFESIKNIGKTEQDLRKEKYDSDLANLDDALAKKLISEEDYLNKSEALRIEYNTQTEKTSKENAEKQKALDQSVQDAKFQMAQDTLSLIMNITELFGSKNEKAARRAFAIEKAAKLTSATLSGIEGTINAFKTASDSPLNALIPGYNFIQAGLAGAFAATNIAKIASTQFGGSKKPDTSSGGGGGGGGNVSSTPSYNLYGNNNNQNTANASMQQQVNVNNQVKVKAYVSETDITNTQERVARYKNSAEL